MKRFSGYINADAVVLDTNILFSALISPHGFPDKIYREWCASGFDMVTFTCSKRPVESYTGQ